MFVKTKVVSKKLNVNPSTVQRWVKYFDLPCCRNSHGHLLFSEQDMEQLEKIKDHLNQGLGWKEVKSRISVSKRKETDQNIGIKKDQYAKKLESMISRMDDVERKLERKADEVASVRLYHHRKELDKLSKTLEEVKSQLAAVERKITNKDSSIIGNEKQPVEKRQRKNWFVSIFGM